MSDNNNNKNSKIFDYKNFLGGAVGGFIGTFTSHPFDTIKNRIQTNNSYNIYNIRDLYKGISVPLYGIALEKTIVFGAYNTTNNILNNHYNFSNQILNASISGLVAGFLCTIIVTPVEKIKINLQNAKTSCTTCVKTSCPKQQSYPSNIYKNLYKGWTATLTREVPGYSIYFTTYELCKKYIYTNNNKVMTTFDNFIIGGLCGLTSWIFIYPQDKIKTIIQNTPADKKIADVFREIRLNEGYKGFYRGFSLCLMRAIPLHAGVFLGYDIVQSSFF